VEPSAKLLDTDKLAEVLGVSVSTIKTWARKGLIPSLRVGKRTIRFDLGAVRAAMERNAVCVTA